MPFQLISLDRFHRNAGWLHSCWFFYRLLSKRIILIKHFLSDLTYIHLLWKLWQVSSVKSFGWNSNGFSGKWNGRCVPKVAAYRIIPFSRWCFIPKSVYFPLVLSKAKLTWKHESTSRSRKENHPLLIKGRPHLGSFHNFARLLIQCELSRRRRWASSVLMRNAK